MKISTHRLGSLSLLTSERPARREKTNLEWKVEAAAVSNGLEADLIFFFFVK
jgi:hypothetical protein